MKNTPNIINTRDISAADRPLAPVVDGNRPAAGNGKATYKTATAAANAAKTYASEAAQAAVEARAYELCAKRERENCEKIRELVEARGKRIAGALFIEHVVLVLAIALSVCNLLILIF